MQRRGIGRALMQQIERHFPPAERFELFTGHRSPVNLLFMRAWAMPASGNKKRRPH